MKLSALTLAIGILTPLYIASAQSRPATAATPPCPSGVAGPFYVYILGKGFQPSLPYNTDPNKSYAPPASTTILTLTLPPNITPDTPAMVADLTEAFANAPSFFLQQLCGLDGIFISVKDCTNFTNYICSGSLTPAQITQDSWATGKGHGNSRRVHRRGITGGISRFRLGRGAPQHLTLPLTAVTS